MQASSGGQPRSFKQMETLDSHSVAHMHNALWFKTAQRFPGGQAAEWHGVWHIWLTQAKCGGQASSLEQVFSFPRPGQVNSPAAFMTNLFLHWQLPLCKLATQCSLGGQTEVAPHGDLHMPTLVSQYLSLGQSLLVWHLWGWVGGGCFGLQFLLALHRMNGLPV